jgi:hypothetical protein
MSYPASQLPPDRAGLPGTSAPTAATDPPFPLLPDLDEPAGFTLARLALLLVVMITTVRVLHLSSEQAWAMVSAGTVWALGLSASWATPLAGAGLAWLLGTGFMEHRTGDLSFATIDREHLGLLGVVAVLALLIRARARARSAQLRAPGGSGGGDGLSSRGGR